LTVITQDNESSTTNGYVKGPISSTSSAAAPPSSPNSSGDIQLPPAQILCTFLDGGVGLYDLGKRKWSFLRDMVCCIIGLLSKFTHSFTHSFACSFIYIYSFIHLFFHTFILSFICFVCLFIHSFIHTFMSVNSKVLYYFDSHTHFQINQYE